MNSAQVHCSRENSQKLRLLFMNSSRNCLSLTERRLEKKKKRESKTQTQTQNVYPNPALIY